MTRNGLILAFTALGFLMLPAPAFGQVVATDVKCNGCVGSIDIRDGGIRTRDIAAGAISDTRIASGAVDWEKLAVSLQERIVQLEAMVAAHEDALVNNTVLKLDGYLDLDTTDPSKPTARFAGVNVQVVNGVGTTDTVNGLGNVLVGYDELLDDPGGVYAICSDGEYDDQTDCEAAGEAWSSNHKSGSHNLVIGKEHRYSQASGLIAGFRNAVNRTSGSVSGGRANTASGLYSVVSGGSFNDATGWLSVVTGGASNTASSDQSIVSGGYSNTASGKGSAVSGGESNIAYGNGAVVSGGGSNYASGENSVVSGGYINSASREHSVVSGGRDNTASGVAAVVSGGSEREASEAYDWVAGELWQDQ